MLLRQNIQQAYEAQQVANALPVGLVPRAYMEQLNTSGGHMEVISGIRRCGKSTLMRSIMQQYGVNTAFFNFEDTRVAGFESSDFQKLDEVMGTERAAYFFDEIQNVPQWELFVRQLHDRGEKVFITGSNASLLSRELGTRLTGRHVRHELFPFSYSEFLHYRNLGPGAETLSRYLMEGGFPEYLGTLRIEVLQTLFQDIVMRDIAVRHGIRNPQVLMDIALHLLSNVGKETTFNKLARSFGVGSVNSVSDYMKWLQDSYLIQLVPMLSSSARQQAINPKKVYAIDTGMAVANSLSMSEDRGRLLENAVYLHLRHQQHTVFYFKGKAECDFVVMHGNRYTQAIQVCDELHTDNLDRELRGLAEAMSATGLNEGVIVTRSQWDTFNISGRRVQAIPAHDYFRPAARTMA